GVSHLVQSTRAGAAYGFALAWVIILANIAKYPAFQFGPRYAAATGQSLLEGYRALGMWAFWIYVAVTVGTMFFIQAGVTIFTAGIAAHLFGGVGVTAWAAILLIICAIITAVGRYRLLDGMTKVIIVFLSISTVAAVLIALPTGGNAQPDIPPVSPWRHCLMSRAAGALPRTPGFIALKPSDAAQAMVFCACAAAHSARHGRSGCFPAVPYPPGRLGCFEFVPAAAVKRERGRGRRVCR